MRRGIRIPERFLSAIFESQFNFAIEFQAVSHKLAPFEDGNREDDFGSFY